LGTVPYREAWDLQRAIAAEVSDGSRPDTILLLEHPPVITTGRRTETNELHVPVDAEVELVETDRGGKSTFHGPGQLVCYPVFDPTPFTEWITACGLEDAQFTTLARELGRPVSVREVLPPAVSALAEVFELEIVTEPAAALA